MAWSSFCRRLESHGLKSTGMLLLLIFKHHSNAIGIGSYPHPIYTSYQSIMSIRPAACYAVEAQLTLPADYNRTSNQRTTCFHSHHGTLTIGNTSPKFSKTLEVKLSHDRHKKGTLVLPHGKSIEFDSFKGSADSRQNITFHLSLSQRDFLELSSIINDSQVYQPSEVTSFPDRSEVIARPYKDSYAQGFRTPFSGSHKFTRSNLHRDDDFSNLGDPSKKF